MKRMSVFVAVAVAAAFAITACRSAPTGEDQWAAAEPPFVQQAQANPDEVYVGIGTGRAMSMNAARQMAENRARVSIAQQMNSSVRNMITDYTGTSELEPAMLQFFETVSRTLTEVELRGTRPDTRTRRDGNTFEAWTVITISKSDAHSTIANAAASAHMLAPHASAALWSLDRMDAAFEQRDTPAIIRD
ncbi:MAG: hypothetical protein FWC64_01345 [Treponema sp.]|nr:hypothetical protein [Treponema sp.]